MPSEADAAVGLTTHEKAIMAGNCGRAKRCSYQVYPPVSTPGKGLHFSRRSREPVRTGSCSLEAVTRCTNRSDSGRFRVEPIEGRSLGNRREATACRKPKCYSSGMDRCQISLICVYLRSWVNASGTGHDGRRHHSSLTQKVPRSWISTSVRNG